MVLIFFILLRKHETSSIWLTLHSNKSELHSSFDFNTLSNIWISSLVTPCLLESVYLISKQNRLVIPFYLVSSLFPKWYANRLWCLKQARLCKYFFALICFLNIQELSIQYIVLRGKSDCLVSFLYCLLQEESKRFGLGFLHFYWHKFYIGGNDLFYKLYKLTIYGAHYATFEFWYDSSLKV